MRIKKLKEYVWILVSISLSFFIIKYFNILTLLKELMLILMPVIIGIFYAWLVNPIIRKWSRKDNRNIICIILFCLVLLSIFLFVYFLIPVVMREFGEFMNILPHFVSEVREKIKDVGCIKYLDKFSSYFMDIFPRVLLNSIKKMIGMIGNTIIGLILGLYISFEYENIIRFIFKYLKKKEIDDLFCLLSDGVRKCIYGTIIVALFVFIIDSVIFIIIGLDAPILLGLLCGITDLIPYIGPYIGGSIAVLVGFTEKKILGFISLGACIMVQSIENYFLQPMVMSKSVKIRPMYILIGLIIFGKLFGIVGMVLAAPIVTIIKVLFSYFINKFDKINE